jgi:putative transcriptional regulator
MRRPQKQRLGARLVAEFSELRNTLRSGRAIEKRYTVRTVELDLAPRQYDADAVRSVRSGMGVSQAVFAQIVGASVDLIAAWEQGHRQPGPMACRLLELIERDKDEWIRRLRDARKMRASA